MNHRVVIGVVVVFVCVGVGIDYVCCSKVGTERKDEAALQKRFLYRRKANKAKEAVGGHHSKRSEYIHGTGTEQEPITKIIDKLKWFVEHKGKRTPKLPGTFEGHEGVDQPQVREKTFSPSGEGREIRNEETEKKGSESNAGNDSEDTSNSTHYIEADFGKEQSTLDGLLNTHRVNRLKMVLPGGREFNLLNDDKRKDLHESGISSTESTTASNDKEAYSSQTSSRSTDDSGSEEKVKGRGDSNAAEADIGNELKKGEEPSAHSSSEEGGNEMTKSRSSSEREASVSSEGPREHENSESKSDGRAAETMGHFSDDSGNGDMKEALSHSGGRMSKYRAASDDSQSRTDSASGGEASISSNDDKERAESTSGHMKDASMNVGSKEESTVKGDEVRMASKEKDGPKYHEEEENTPMKVKEASHFKESEANSDMKEAESSSYQDRDSKQGRLQEGHRVKESSKDTNEKENSEKESSAYKAGGRTSSMNEGTGEDQESQNIGSDGRVQGRFKEHNSRPALKDRDASDHSDQEQSFSKNEKEESGLKDGDWNLQRSGKGMGRNEQAPDAVNLNDKEEPHPSSGLKEGEGSRHREDNQYMNENEKESRHMSMSEKGGNEHQGENPSQSKYEKENAGVKEKDSSSKGTDSSQYNDDAANSSFKEKERSQEKGESVNSGLEEKQNSRYKGDSQEQSVNEKERGTDKESASVSNGGDRESSQYKEHGQHAKSREREGSRYKEEDSGSPLKEREGSQYKEESNAPNKENSDGDHRSESLEASAKSSPESSSKAPDYLGDKMNLKGSEDVMGSSEFDGDVGEDKDGKTPSKLAKGGNGKEDEEGGSEKGRNNKNEESEKLKNDLEQEAKEADRALEKEVSPDTDDKRYDKKKPMEQEGKQREPMEKEERGRGQKEWKDESREEGKQERVRERKEDEKEAPSPKGGSRESSHERGAKEEEREGEGRKEANARPDETEGRKEAGDGRMVEKEGRLRHQQEDSAEKFMKSSNSAGGEINGKELLHKVEEEISQSKVKEKTKEYSEKEPEDAKHGTKEKSRGSKSGREKEYAGAEEKHGKKAEEEPALDPITADAPEVVDHNHYMPHSSGTPPSMSGSFERPAYSDQLSSPPLTNQLGQLPQPPQTQSQYQHMQRGKLSSDENKKGPEMFGKDVQLYHKEGEVPMSGRTFHQDPWYQHGNIQSNYPVGGGHVTSLSTPCSNGNSDCHHMTYDSCHHETCSTPACNTCQVTPCETCHHDCDCCCPLQVHRVTHKFKHKPDIIKVEFVPEEVSITVGNKTDKTKLNPPPEKPPGYVEKPSGKIKVQFVPGEAIIESSKPALEDAVARSVDSAANDKVIGTVTLENGRLSGLHSAQQLSPAVNQPISPESFGGISQPLKKTAHTSINGYDAHPYLPFLPKPLNEKTADTRAKDQGVPKKEEPAGGAGGLPGGRALTGGAAPGGATSGNLIGPGVGVAAGVGLRTGAAVGGGTGAAIGGGAGALTGVGVGALTGGGAGALVGGGAGAVVGAPGEIGGGRVTTGQILGTEAAGLRIPNLGNIAQDNTASIEISSKASYFTSADKQTQNDPLSMRTPVTERTSGMTSGASLVGGLGGVGVGGGGNVGVETQLHNPLDDKHVRMETSLPHGMEAASAFSPVTRMESTNAAFAPVKMETRWKQEGNKVETTASFAAPPAKMEAPAQPQSQPAISQQAAQLSPPLTSPNKMAAVEATPSSTFSGVSRSTEVAAPQASGYEKKPSLPPFLDKSAASAALEEHAIDVATAEGKPIDKPASESPKPSQAETRTGTPTGASEEPALPGGGDGRGGGGGGGSGVARDATAVPSLDTTERIDPELTSLGQQYPNAVNSEVKSALAQEKSTPAGMSAEVAPAANADPDRVFMGGGGGGAISPPDPSFTSGPMGSPEPNPDPNPTMRSPSDPVSASAGSTNVVAAHIADAINNKGISQEEALQMMNDFVSGNQDMTKAAKNVDTMIAQISKQRGGNDMGGAEAVPGDPVAPTLGSSQGLALPGEIIRSPDEIKFVNPNNGPGNGGGGLMKVDDTGSTAFMNPKDSSDARSGGPMHGGNRNAPGAPDKMAMSPEMEDKSKEMLGGGEGGGGGMEKASSQMFNHMGLEGGKNAAQQQQQMFAHMGMEEGKNSLQQQEQQQQQQQQQQQMFNSERPSLMEEKGNGNSRPMFNPNGMYNSAAASIDAKISQIANNELNMLGGGAGGGGLVDKASVAGGRYPSGAGSEPGLGPARNSEGGPGSPQQNSFMNPMTKYGNEYNNMPGGPSPHAVGGSPIGDFSTQGEYITQDLSTGAMRRVGQQSGDLLDTFRGEFGNPRQGSHAGNNKGENNMMNAMNSPNQLGDSFGSNFQKPMDLNSRSQQSSSSGLSSFMESGGKSAASQPVRGGLGSTEMMNNLLSGRNGNDMMPGNAGSRSGLTEMGRGGIHLSGGPSGSESNNNSPVVMEPQSATARAGTPASHENMIGNAANMMSNVRKPNPVHFFEPGTSSTSPASSLGRTMQSMMSHPYGDPESDTPQGHIMPMNVDPAKAIGLPETSDLGGGFSRKFRTPHASDVVHPPVRGLKKLSGKTVPGARKDNVIADMYADTVFPDDISDIDSLQGSLAGKTLTGYD